MFENIPGNVPEEPGECYYRLRGMLEKIPGNVQAKFRLFLVKSCFFLSNFGVNLLQNSEKNKLLSKSSKKTFSTLLLKGIIT